MLSAWKDDKGNWSSLRIGLTYFALLFSWGSILVYMDWRSALIAELSKDNPDYEGVTNLFERMLIGFVGGILVAGFIKVFQKYFETKN